MVYRDDSLFRLTLAWEKVTYGQFRKISMVVLDLTSVSVISSCETITV